jgi:hypothetical protein
MKTLKNILLVLLVITIPVIGHSQEENADAVYNKLTKEYVLNGDGTMEFHLHKELRILTHFAFHRLFGETFIIYDTTYQELNINEAYTLMADGKRVDAPDNAFNEVLPRFARDIPAYNHLREMVVTHTGLEVGAVIVLDYTILTKDPFIPHLMGNESIGENVPVKEMEVTVKVPSGVELTHKMLGLRTAPVTAETREGKSYTWTFNGLKAHSMEPYQDPSLAPRLLFSTAKDLPGAYFEFVNQPAFRHELGDDLAKRTEEALKDVTGDIKKMLVLQDVIVKEMKLAEIPLEHTGFRVRTPAAVWQATNATPLEMAVMLSDMLIHANINAIPVALIPDLQFDRSMGNLLTFEKFAVQVNPKETGRFYLSVTGKNDQNMIYDLEGYTALQLDGAIESLRTFSDELEEKDNEISLEGELTLNGTDMLTGELTMELEGQLNPYFKFLEKEDAVKGALSGGLSSSSIKTYQVTELDQDASEVVFTIESKEPMKEAGSFYSLELPALSMDMRQYQLEGMSDTRAEPLLLPVDIDEEYEYTINLPDGWELFSPETDLEIENGAGTLEISIQHKKGRIMIEKDIEIKRDISVADYPGFLELVRTWSDERHNRLVLGQ